MKRLIHLLWLVFAMPAIAAPDVTVLLPVDGAMSPESITSALHGSASARVAHPDSPIAQVADALFRSDVALVVLDATHGPLPANREHILAARQAAVPDIVVLLTNVDGLYKAVGEAQGRELLALEEQEIRNLLEVYGAGGVDTRVYHDSHLPQRGTRTMTGDSRRLASDLSRLETTARDYAASRRAHAAGGHVYLLAQEEANGHGVTIDGSREFRLWIGGQTVTARIAVDGVAGPGDVVEFRYRSDDPAPATEGARMMLINDGRIVGIGVIAAD